MMLVRYVQIVCVVENNACVQAKISNDNQILNNFRSEITFKKAIDFFFKRRLRFLNF